MHIVPSETVREQRKIRQEFDAQHPFGKPMMDFICPKCERPMTNTEMWGPTCINCGFIKTL
ncbi:MAG: hypothetical protein WC427_01575 [Candidatus Paceibacterota bacterium]